jgi:O-antigen/teichoic acid export membrane protein
VPHCATTSLKISGIANTPQTTLSQAKRSSRGIRHRITQIAGLLLTVQRRFANRNVPSGTSTLKMQSNTERRLFRAHRLKLALGTSLISKATTAAISFYSIPLICNQTTLNGYAAFCTATALTSWISVLFINLATPLSLAIAQEPTTPFVRHYLAKGIRLTLVNLAFAVIIAAVFGAIFYGYIKTTCEHYEQFDIIFVIAVLGTAQLVNPFFVPIEAAQTGLQETHLLNYRNALANSLTLAGLLFLSLKPSSLIEITFALTLPAVLTRIANAALFYYRHSIKPEESAPLPSQPQSLLADSALLSAATAGSNYLCHQLPVLILIKQSPTTGALFSAGISLISALLGLVTIITAPLAPAIADARANDDWNWVKRAHAKTTTSVLALAASISILISTFGTQIIATLTRSPNTTVTFTFTAALAMYLFILIFEKLYFELLLSLRLYISAGTSLILRGLASAFLIWMTEPTHTTYSPFIILTICSLFDTAYLLGQFNIFVNDKARITHS